MASMTPTGLISDVVVVLPSGVVEQSTGLAIDIGCTNAKLVYRSNKEYRNGKPIKPQSDPTKGQVHYALFPRSDNIEVLVKYIQENADLTADESGDIVVHCAGIGGAAFKSEIESGLKCILQVHSEFDCFIKAFFLLEKSLSPDELLESVHPDLEAEIEEKFAPIRTVYEHFQSLSEMKVTLRGDTGDIKDSERPRLLVMGGSGTGVIQINRDGTSSLLGIQTLSGRFMQGLAGFLTGEKDYKRQEQMAASSDGQTTDTWYTDLQGPTKGDNFYNRATELDTKVFTFGKGVKSNLEDATKEDLVYSSFTVTAMAIAQMVFYCAQLSGAKDVIFCGNLFNSQIMRKMMLEERIMTEIYTETKTARYHFVKNGGMLGALGALICTNK